MGNIVGKGENAGFPKLSFEEVLNVGIVWERPKVVVRCRSDTDAPRCDFSIEGFSERPVPTPPSSLNPCRLKGGYLDFSHLTQLKIIYILLKFILKKNHQ